MDFTEGPAQMNTSWRFCLTTLPERLLRSSLRIAESGKGEVEYSWWSSTPGKAPLLFFSLWSSQLPASRSWRLLMQIYNSNSCSNAFFYAEDENVALRWKFSCAGAEGSTRQQRLSHRYYVRGFKYPYFDIFAPVIDPQKLIGYTAKKNNKKNKQTKTPQQINRNRPF